MDTRTPRVTAPLSVQRQTSRPSFGLQNSNFGAWYDPRHNTQFRQFMTNGRGWAELLMEFAYPYLNPGDYVLMRFPFSEWNRQFYWNDILTCKVQRTAWYAGIKQAVDDAIFHKLRPVLYMPSPNLIELNSKISLLEDFPPCIVALDANIGTVPRIEGMQKFRDGLEAHGHVVYLEPGWDRNCQADWEYPILVQSDLYQTVKDQNGANWVWPFPTDGSGPEITMWHHERYEGDLKEAVRTWVQGCFKNHWSVLIEGDLFHNHPITRKDVV